MNIKNKIITYALIFFICFGIFANARPIRANAVVIADDIVYIAVATIVAGTISVTDWDSVGYVVSDVVANLSETVKLALETAYKSGKGAMELTKDLLLTVKTQIKDSWGKLVGEPVYSTTWDGRTVALVNLKPDDQNLPYSTTIRNYKLDGNNLVFNKINNLTLILDNGNYYLNWNNSRIISGDSFNLGDSILKVRFTSFASTGGSDMIIVPLVNTNNGYRTFGYFYKPYQDYVGYRLFAYVTSEEVAPSITIPNVPEDVISDSVISSVSGSISISKPTTDTLEGVKDSSITVTDVETGDNLNKEDDNNNNGINFKPLLTIGDVLKTVFPFCLVFDLGRFIDGLEAEPVAPVITVNMPQQIVGGGQLVLDFSIFNNLALIVRTFLVLIFTVSLIILTRRII